MLLKVLGPVGLRVLYWEIAPHMENLVLSFILQDIGDRKTLHVELLYRDILPKLFHQLQLAISQTITPLSKYTSIYLGVAFANSFLNPGLL
jgi:hypothetical protein